MKIYVGKRDERGFFPVRFVVRRDGEVFAAQATGQRGDLSNPKFAEMGKRAVITQMQAALEQRLAQVNPGEES